MTCFSNANPEWVQLTVEDYEDWLVEAAAGELNLDTEQFAADLTSPEMEAMAQKAWDDAVGIGIPGTPFLLINDSIWPSNVPANVDTVSALVEMTKLEERQFTECPPQVIDPAKQYKATLHTSKGDIVIELLSDDAPMAVNSFVFLSQNDWFDGVMFHRVLPGFVAQSGDPTGTGFGGPGYAFNNEISPDLKFDQPGPGWDGERGTGIERQPILYYLRARLRPGRRIYDLWTGDLRYGSC
jgi:hypothetical protein